MAGNLGSTVTDLINEAAGILGIYQGSGDPLSAGDLASFYFTLGGIVDGWGSERLTIVSTAILPFTTQAGKQSYNIGPAAAGIDWVATPLPPAFTGVGMLTGTLEIGINVVTTDDWVGIGLKSLQSGIPAAMWPDLGTASHTLNFWPVPNAAIPILLYVPLVVPAFTSTSNTLLLQPGYLEALVYELALKASSKFGAQLPEWLPAAWSAAKSRIKEASFEALDVQCDPAIVSGGPAGGGSIAFYQGR